MTPGIRNKWNDTTYVRAGIATTDCQAVDAVGPTEVPLYPPRRLEHSAQGLAAAYAVCRWARASDDGQRGGTCDSATAASFVASLECELLERTVLRTKSAARRAPFSYIEGWCVRAE